MLYELSRGLAYRTIRHPQMRLYTNILPLVLTLIIASSLLFLPYQPVYLGKDGLISSALSVLATLPGFFFAGLAAVATFSGLNMDAVMADPAPSVEVTVGGQRQLIYLSRRQFLSYLFSYLVLLSFALCVASLAINAAAPSLAALKTLLMVHQSGQVIWTLVKTIAVVIYVAMASSVVVTTLHGMFFLTERIHQP